MKNWRLPFSQIKPEVFHAFECENEYSLSLGQKIYYSLALDEEKNFLLQENRMCGVGVMYLGGVYLAEQVGENLVQLEARIRRVLVHLSLRTVHMKRSTVKISAKC